MAARRGRQRVPAAVEHRPATSSTPALEVRSSAKRTKTATAWWEGAKLVVALPARVKGDEREQLITWLVERSRRRRPALVASDPELLERARQLVESFNLGVMPTSVRFVANQRRRWGSCSVASGAIRLSDRLRNVPGWVLDAVLVHELAHLAVPDHSAAFHALANRHPRQADATIFLDGYQLGLTTVSEQHGEETVAPLSPGPPAGDVVQGSLDLE